ncbi:TPA: hypothetical protein HA231_00540 [Candidatus Woesearchaeota archaeon]|nr:hypothetical protein [Candidatus Woesearchaeota archaeon]
MNKSGSGMTGEEMVYWLVKVVFTVLVAVLTVSLIRAFIMTTVEVGPLESALLSNVPYFSENGFSAVDPVTGRVYIGMVDPALVSTATAEDIFKADKPVIIGRFVLNQTAVDYALHPETGKVGCSEPGVASTDSERYRLWQPIAMAAGRGEGGKAAYPEARYVATVDGKGAIMQTVFISSN